MSGCSHHLNTAIWETHSCFCSHLKLIAALEIHNVAISNYRAPSANTILVSVLIARYLPCPFWRNLLALHHSSMAYLNFLENYTLLYAYVSCLYILYCSYYAGTKSLFVVQYLLAFIAPNQNRVITHNNIFWLLLPYFRSCYLIFANIVLLWLLSLYSTC